MQEKIKSKKEIRNILQLCCSNKIPADVSFVISRNKIIFNSVFIRLNQESVTLFLNSINGINALYIDKLLNIKFCYKDKNYDFDVKCLKKDEVNMRIEASIPKQILRGERRQHVRYKPEDKILCRIKYNENVSFNGILEDISKGGLQFTSQLNNHSIMKKGLKIHISFMLKNTVRRYHVEICYFSNGKCGCKFI